MSETFNATCPPGLRLTEKRSARLRARMAGPDLLIAPGCFDCLTARLVETAGFEAAYITGSGLSMSCLGAPDVGLASFSEVFDRVKRICDVLTIPVIADGDTGFGGPLNILRTVREFERAGVSAIQIEDQEAPKRCGHELGRKLVAPEEMEARVKAACDARLDDAFLVIARTDARSSSGLQAAINRAGRYLEAGADVLFVESPESEAEMEAICRAFPKVPMLANMVEGGRTPLLPASQLESLGYRLAIFPNSLTRLIGKMGLELMQDLKSSGTTASQAERMFDHRALWSLFDYDDWISLEARYATDR
ncbi:isocitrate lyase/PEP mutase family protein [Algihabitans albus]|uniref:isocitrate lyase/PEP mutase family protein n=1 Tax=Algihabitans albus TaxID=2164067 RepID=UPI000E5C9754|nr:isocitrate lyase/phosphoenolpyruvate mutase family protein [Algihabitans albus]